MIFDQLVSCADASVHIDSTVFQALSHLRTSTLVPLGYIRVFPPSYSAVTQLHFVACKPCSMV